MKPRHSLLDTGRDASWRDIGLLIARIGFGGTLILRHGYAKIPALVAVPIQFFDPVGLGAGPSLAAAVLAEVVCAFALVVGYFTRLACVPLVVNFSVIVFVLHRVQVPGDRGELALLYLLAFLLLLFAGPGRYSIDHLKASRQRPSAQNSFA